MANINGTKLMIEACWRNGAVPCLVSGSGKGKTSLGEQLAASLGGEFLPLQVAQLEPPDILGLPAIIDSTLCETPRGVGELMSIEGRLVVMRFPDGSLDQFEIKDLKVLSKEKLTQHMRPEMFPHASLRTPGIILLDELNRAKTDVRAALLDFIAFRRILRYTLPESWHLMAAMNPPGGGYQTHDLGPALNARLAFINFAPSMEDWISHESGKRGGKNIALFNFLRDHPTEFSDQEDQFKLPVKKTNRGWSTVAKMEEDPAISHDIKRELYFGIVGASALLYLKRIAGNTGAIISIDDLRNDLSAAIETLNTVDVSILTDCLSAVCFDLMRGREHEILMRLVLQITNFDVVSSVMFSALLKLRETDESEYLAISRDETILGVIKARRIA
jgi:hypothetical protein